MLEKIDIPIMSLAPSLANSLRQLNYPQICQYLEPTKPILPAELYISCNYRVYWHFLYCITSTPIMIQRKFSLRENKGCIQTWFSNSLAVTLIVCSWNLKLVASFYWLIPPPTQNPRNHAHQHKCHTKINHFYHILQKYNQQKIL